MHAQESIISNADFTSRKSSIDTWKIDAQVRSQETSLAPKMSKNKGSMRTLLHEFAKETTAHGIGKIDSADSVIWRIFWALAVMAGTGMVIYQGILLLGTYLSKPVKSDIDVTYSRTVKFPAVTVCNLNMLKRSFVHNFAEAKKIIASFDDFMEGKKRDGENEHLPSVSGSNTSFGPPDQRRELMKNSLKIDHSGAEEHLSLSNVTVDSQAYAEDLIVGKLAAYDDKKLKEGGHSFHEFVFRCNWKDFNCKEGDFFKYWTRTWNWRYGNCFSFNSGATSDGKKAPVLTSTKPGPKFGLTLDLFVNQMEYIPSLTQEAGVRVLLTPQRVIPFPVDEGFTVSPGFSTSVGLRQLQIKRVDPFKNGSCYEKDTLEAGSIYNKKYKGSTYTVQGCMYSCLAQAQTTTCNCTEGKFRTGAKVCSDILEVKCIQEVTQRYERGELGCSKSCPQRCSHLSYRTSISSSSWSSNYVEQIQKLMRRDKDSNFVSMGKHKDVLRDNFLRINIYFEELNMEEITYSEYYLIENLMSDIGGQLGLWIGVSVITIAEMLKLLLDILHALCRKAHISDDEEIKEIRMT
ncbi:degenerin deg-1-like isoform X2 [Acropora millepora]|uniref:degenerin deg-1-like isoform X2 n=1 Tax=Acropora millepora TaxID=45264 RepID=UPI001CF4F0DC|nr:degenerin deg-1-like isoform X2 [Acropora millepora]XP_044180482.1 degenerin deg-1-like isoform X2 [Acropora millepora]XP_044180483.1 degenerin deg-1-like isoform X2 [Acropora millepora]XP_044180484.1 degenerin deg-1-like isoform X2 [Acropora millepora]XP_044180487.1 degenerin deg-1-like isoform X2 [Acropora millepora]XP_044180492.1 degenerin deg-1-like isoform X2 [Acropora millepora]XP_044180498.1 degenerin deg-1-like isoform X2 [Acropora millepora]XP_044180503.1 degenerin deg-1-like iso